MTRGSVDSAVQANTGMGALALLAPVALAGFWCGGCLVSPAQTQSACGAEGYRVVARNWDPVLRRGWESRQECQHPEWPLRLAAIKTVEGDTASVKSAAAPMPTPAIEQQPLLVKAGDKVRVWMQDQAVRIEMSGVVERSAHQGERVVVQITRQDDETGLTVQRIAGMVSGAGEVEMDR
jgi:hypothetical protein